MYSNTIGQEYEELTPTFFLLHTFKKKKKTVRGCFV